MDASRALAGKARQWRMRFEEDEEGPWVSVRCAGPGCRAELAVWPNYEGPEFEAYAVLAIAQYAAVRGWRDEYGLGMLCPLHTDTVSRPVS